MARNILFEVTVLNGSTPVTLRMAHASASSAGVQINGYQWLPLVTKRPAINAGWSENGVFTQGSITYGGLSFRMSEAYGNNVWSAYEWTGALARIFVQNGDNEGDFASYKQIFEGTVSSLNRQGTEATVELLGPEALLDLDLLTLEYAGTGNAEGPAGLKGKLKPRAFGNCQNVEPVQVDPARYIYQVHAYGPVQGITPYDFGQALDPAKNKGDASDYATLANLPLVPGEWATCAALGMFRFGGATDKKVTADVTVGGMSAGTIISSLLTAAGIPGTKIAIGSLFQNWCFYAKDQVSIGEVAQLAAYQTGNWLFADGTGTWQTMDFYAPKAPITLNADRSTMPLVKSYREVNAAAPVWKVRVGHSKCWSVHSSSDVSPSLAINSDDVQAALTAAQNANDAAAVAQSDANIAKQRLDAIESDGVLDRSEKADIVLRFGSYTAERTALLAQGTTYGLTTERTNYDNAYSQLKTYLEGLLPSYTDSTQNTPIDRATFTNRFTSYLTARQALLNAVANKTATVASWSGVSGPGKPADNATVGAPIGTNVGDVPAGTVVDAIKDSNGTVKPTREQVAAAKAALDASISAANDKITQIQGSVNSIVGTSIPDLARRITDAEGVNTTQGQTLTTYGTNISNVTQQASTTAGNLATLEKTVQAGNLNLLKNGGFDNGLVNWNTVGTWQAAPLATAVYGRHVYALATANNQTLWIYSEMMPIKAGLTYAASARMRVLGTTGRARLDVEWFDANMQQITPNAYGNSIQAPKEFGEASRTSTAAVGTAPNGAVWARVRLIGELLSTGDQVAFQQAKFEIGAAPTAYSSEATTTQTFTAIQTTNEQVAQLSTTVGTQGSSITSLQTATSNLQGDMATVQTRLLAGSPNLLGNGGFEDGLRAWNAEIGSWSAVAGNVWGSYADWSRQGAQTSGERAVVLAHAPVLFDPGLPFTFTIDASAYNEAGNSYARLEVDFFADAAMSQRIGSTFGGPAAYNLWFGNTPGQNRKNLAVSGVSPNHTQAMWAKCRVIFGNMTNDGRSGASVRQAKFERSPVPTTYSNEVSLTQSYQAISSLDGQRAAMQSQLNTQGSSINDLRTSTTTLQGSVAQVTQRLVAGSPNLLPNGGFENGRNSWADVIGNWGASGGLGDTWGSYIYWGGSGATTDGERYVIADSYPFVIEGGAQFALSGDANVWNSSGNAYCRLEVMFYSDTAATNEIGHVWGPNVTQPSFWNEPGYNRQRLATFGTSPAGTQRCRVRLVGMGMFNGSNSGTAFRQIKFERGTVLTPYSGEASALQNYQVLSTATQQLASLTNTVSAQGATVSTQQTAISNLQGRTGAYWQVQAVAGNQRAQITVRADANGGGGVDFGGDVNFTGSLNVGADSGGNRMKITNQNIQVFDGNGTRRVAFGLNF